MTLSASDFYTYLYPHECGLRVYLESHGAESAPPSPYLEVVRQLGRRHESEHLATLGPHLDLRGLSAIEREQRTREAVHDGVAAIYQSRLRAAVQLGGATYELVGEPDYLIRQGDGYVIRDSKVAREITEEQHPEILRQLETYGWLYEHALGSAAGGLEVHAGTNEIVPVPYDGGDKALTVLNEIVGWQTSATEPYQPVSWSGCGPCAFGEYCLSAAEQRKDPAFLPGVDKGLAVALRAAGVATWNDLLASFDEPRLSDLKRPWGKGAQRVGKRAGNILRSAEAFSTNTEVWHAKPALPQSQDWVMFDLEGFPPQLDEDEMVFVWGMQVFGAHPSEYIAATPSTGSDGDEVAWHAFLRQAQGVFGQYGDIPFVHWASYERDRIDKYIERYGDVDGVAARVRASLFDMLPAVRDSVALPLPSYSLKVLEQHVGYQRTQQEYGGEWAMATYYYAVHSADPARAAALVDEVLKYNREDLEATWAVLRWLLPHAA